MTSTQRTRHLLKGAAVLVATIAGLGAVPVGLVRYVGWPLPATVPSLDEIALALRSGIDPQLVINVLAVIVWVTCAQLGAALITETWAVTRGRVAQRAPVLPGLQHVAARIVATVALLAAAIGPIRQPAIAAPPAPVAVVEAMTLAAVATQPAIYPGSETQGASQTPVIAAAVPVVEYPTYTAGRFDTLWSIADDTLGDGTRWRDIRQLNTGRVMTDGTRITDATERIAPGWTLRLPTDATLPTTPNTDSPTETEGQVTVQAGDHFWSIAETTLTQAWGHPPTTADTTTYWQRLVDLNRDRLRPPHNPDLIWPGQTFQLPDIPPDPTTPLPAGAIPDAASGEVAVQPGDHFWRIAEDTIEADWGREASTAEISSYWRSLIDLNLDRLQPPNDPNLIHPGQTFQLPDIPTDPHTASDGKEATAGGTPPPDTPTTTPHDRPDTSVPEPSTPPDADTKPPSAPPASTAPPVTSAPPATTGTSDSIPHGLDPAVDLDADVEDADSAGLLPTAARLAGLGLLAAGIVALLNRLRGTQLRLRRPGTIPTPPPTSTAPVEATLRTASAPTAVELIDVALRSLGAHIHRDHLTEPDLAAIRIGPEGIRLLHRTPHAEPPQGWAVGDDGRSWLLPAVTNHEPLRRLAEHTAAPWPALVTVGHHNDTQLLLNLEHPGSLQVTGEPGDVADTLTTMATELAASPLADTMRIYCVGFGHDVAHLERIHPVDDLDQAMRWIDRVLAAVATSTDVTPVQGRLRPGGDTWEPIIVLDPRPVAPDGADRLLVAANSHNPISAVVGYPTGQRWRLHTAGDTVHIDPINITLHRRNLTADEQTAVAQLTATAKDLDGVPDPDATPTAELHTPTHLESGSAPPEPDANYRPIADEQAASEPDTAPDPEPATESQQHLDPQPAPDEEPASQPSTAADATTSPPALTPPSQPPEVFVLGNIRIDGLNHRFPRRRSREVVTYLAVHRNGVDPDALTEAIWPDAPPLPHRVIRYLSEARTTLGDTPTGDPYLPPLGDDGLYRVHPHLGCDLDRLEHHLHEAKTATEPNDKARHLQAGLALVDGPPFTGGTNDGYSWAHTEGLVSHATIAIDNAAHQLAEQALQYDDPDTATWAARKGILVTRTCEQCYRHLMRSGIAANSHTAVEAAYQQLIAITEADEGPDATDLLDPETTELYEQHRRLRYHQPQSEQPQPPADDTPSGQS